MRFIYLSYRIVSYRIVSYRIVSYRIYLSIYPPLVSVTLDVFPMTFTFMARGRHRGPSTQVVPKSYPALALFTVVPCRGSGAATIHGHDPDESYKNMVSNLAGACFHGPSRVMWHPAIEFLKFGQILLRL